MIIITLYKTIYHANVIIFQYYSKKLPLWIIAFNFATFFQGEWVN